MCGSGPRSSATEIAADRSRLDLDPGPAAQPRQQPTKVARGHSHATLGGRPIRPRHMEEDSAASAGDARAGVVVDLDDEIVKVVLPPEPVPWFIGRPPERAVVATV